MKVETTFVLGRMNKSVDERLVPKGEYVDAMNIRVGSTEGSEEGVIENAVGNTQLTFLRYDSEALSDNTRCIGAYEDGMSETMYWFLHDPTNTASGGVVDMIVSYNTNNQEVSYHVISTSVLNFDPAHLITAVNYIDGMLYFTDGYNPPRRINVKSNYPYPTTAHVDKLQEEDILVIVKPPGFNLDEVGSPRVELINIAGEDNYIEERLVSFAYRFRYENGEYSATSLFTVPAFSPSTFSFSYDDYNNTGMRNRYNGARVTISTGARRVVEVDLLYKLTTSNVIYVVEKFNKALMGLADNTEHTVEFTNSKIYSTLLEAELLRAYDNVPRLAEAQTLMGNRLVYGNFIEGYNIEDANGTPVKIDYSVAGISEDVGYQPITTNPALSEGSYNITTVISVGNAVMDFNLNSLNPVTYNTTYVVLQKGLVFNIEVALRHDSLLIAGGNTNQPTGFATTSPVYISASFVIPETFYSVSELINCSEFKHMIGSVLGVNIEPISTMNEGFSLTDKFNSAINPPTGPNVAYSFENSSIDATVQQGFRVIDTSTVGHPSFSIQALANTYGDVNGNKVYEYFYFEEGAIYMQEATKTSSLHSNRDYEVGKVYMDGYGRASTVLTSSNNTVFFPSSRSDDKNQIQVTINTIPPSWAKYYKMVCKPSEGAYETIYSSTYYKRDDGVVFFKLEGENQNKVKKGDILTVKRDSQGVIVADVKCTVLNIEAQGDGFLTGMLAGLYMEIKPSGFIGDPSTATVLDYGWRKRTIKNKGCQAGLDAFGDKAAYIEYPIGTSGPGDPPVPIPEGTTISIEIVMYREHKNDNCPGRDWVFKKEFISSANYDNMYQWWVGDNIDITQGVDNSYDNVEMPQVFIPEVKTANTGWATSLCNENLFQFGTNGSDASSPEIFRVTTMLRECRNHNVSLDMRVIISPTNSICVFETEPSPVDESLFYDSSEMYKIEGGMHLGGNVAGDQNQTVNTPAVITLPFSNCYTFGNGVESYKVLDSMSGRGFNLGERFLAVSNQDYREVARTYGLTYSGVYQESSNVNNLNIFNLGLANYKDLEMSFGPIQILHGRETDILVLQEDKISYVQAGKNLLSDVGAGGAVVASLVVLGQQVARIEDYGISFNPESFSKWGSDVYFTDAKRGVVIRLSSYGGVQSKLSIISDNGMDAWFRDMFYDKLTTQKIGGYDPFMNEYVLSANSISIPLNETILNCGTILSWTGKQTPVIRTVELGEDVGNVPVVINCPLGEIDVTLSWNNVVQAQFTVNASNSPFASSFNKTLPLPSSMVMTLTPTAIIPSNFDARVDCVELVPLDIIRIALTAPGDEGKTVHTSYGWGNAGVYSPESLTLISFITTEPASYIHTSGLRGQGSFPYSGADIRMRSHRVGSDTYSVDANSDSFSYLSSNTLYTESDIADLIPLLPGGSVIETSPSVFEKIHSNALLPQSNLYLYLIWDFRDIVYADLCYDTLSQINACCDCATTCVTFGSSTGASSASIACNYVGLGKTYYFTGVLSYPSVGDRVYVAPGCLAKDYLASGWYKIGVPGAYSVIQVSVSTGIVLNKVTCV